MIKKTLNKAQNYRAYSARTSLSRRPFARRYKYVKIFLALLVFCQFQSTYANSFRVYDASESSRTFELEKFGEIRLEVSHEKIVTLYFENEGRSIPIDFLNTEYESLVDIHSGRLARSSGENLYLIFDCFAEGTETGDIVVTIENYSVIKIWGRECNDL